MDLSIYLSIYLISSHVEKMLRSALSHRIVNECVAINPSLWKKPMGPHRPIALMENAPRFIIRKPVFQRRLITPVMRVFSVVTSKEKRNGNGEHWVDPCEKRMFNGKKNEKLEILFFLPLKL